MNKKKINVAIIPARGGSKRIPNKNIKDFHGNPLISYSIKTAFKSNLFDKIIVTTDSQKIADVAKKFGAEIPFMRPKNISDDFTATAPVIYHALNWLKVNNYRVNYACCIYATCPLLEKKYLKKGYDLIKKTKAKSVFSVTTFEFPIYRGLKVDKNGLVSMLWPENKNVRSQDLPEVYHDAGQFYWLENEEFMLKSEIYTDKSRVVVIPRELVQDIDTLEDWKIASSLYKLKLEG